MRTGTSTRLSRAFSDRCSTDLPVQPRCPLFAGEYGLPEPDLAVLPLAVLEAGGGAGRHPEAADTEVLGEVVATRRRDARVKSPIYAAAGAPEY